MDASVLSLNYLKESPEISVDFFFKFPSLIDVNFSGFPYFYIPLSISQCHLIERIDLTNTNFSAPPSILFSLPQLRAHPENILFGDDQKCSVDLMHNIIEDSKKCNQGSYKFIDIDGSENIVSFSAETTTNDFVLVMHPELEQFMKYIFLVRTVSLNEENATFKLYIIPENVPLVLYQYPDAVWSIELRFIPNNVSKDFFPYLASYLSLRFPGSAIEKEALSIMKKCNNQQILDNFLEKINSDEKISIFHFKAKLENQSEISIYVNSESIAISVNNSSYFVCDNRKVRLSYITDYTLLVINDRALVIQPSSVQDLSFLFSLISPDYPLRKINQRELYSNKQKKQSFAQIAMKTLAISYKTKRQNRPAPMPLNIATKFDLSSVRSTYFPFVPKSSQNLSQIFNTSTPVRNQTYKL